MPVETTGYGPRNIANPRFGTQFAQGSAELAVDFAGKSTAVAEDLANRKFAGFRLEPISVTPNRIDIQAVVEK